jgi:hypothetical protein
MAVNLATDIKPISYIKTNAADMMKTQDAFALLHLIKIAEKDIKNGDFEPSEKVFSDLRKEILENG